MTDIDGLLRHPGLPVAIALVVSILMLAIRPKAVRADAVANMLVSIGLWFLGPLLFAIYVDNILASVRTGYQSLGIPTLSAAVWKDVPTPFVMLLAFVAHDFCDYWNHRFMHLRWVFPVHAVHHSDTDVNGLTTFRVHGMETIVMQTSYILLMSWMNIPGEPAAILWFLVMLHNCYVHLDLDWTHGPFRHVLASPHFHRWHHADVEVAYGKNLANISPVWDVMFGTYIDPGRCTAPMGSRAMDIPSTNLTRLLIWPTIGWGRLIREELGRRAERQSRGRPSVTTA